MEYSRAWHHSGLHSASSCGRGQGFSEQGLLLEPWLKRHQCPWPASYQWLSIVRLLPAWALSSPDFSFGCFIFFKETLRWRAEARQHLVGENKLGKHPVKRPPHLTTSAQRPCPPEKEDCRHPKTWLGTGCSSVLPPARATFPL